MSCETRPDYCGTFHTDPPPPPTWTISASTLQILWGEIFPRMVAQAWLLYCADPFPPGDITASLANDLVQFRNVQIGSSNPTPTQVATFNATRFGRRLEAVRTYLSTSPPQRMPIRYHGSGGFDFILSDYGLDLFAPRMPPSMDELLRYYEFRDPGRPTIGLPMYLEDSRVFDVHSPSGPSQIWIGQQGGPVAINASGCTLEDILECIGDEGIKYPPEVEVALDRAKALQQVGHRDSGLTEYLDSRFPAFTPVRGFTFEAFFAATSKLRCWQLEGSVYRGILEQLPRVVATMWREQRACAALADSYTARFTDPRRMREIFEERLETMLPAYDDMVFEVGPRPGQALVDIEISNQGLRFPDAPRPGDWSELVSPIAKGKAGNPVFTDSKRTDQD